MYTNALIAPEVFMEFAKYLSLKITKSGPKGYGTAI